MQTVVGKPKAGAFEALPRRIFLDSCAAQTLRDYDGFIFEGECVPEADRVWQIPNGMANIEALRDIFLVNQRAQFEWIVTAGSLREANDKQDAGHMRWLREIADHTEVCLDGAGPMAENEALAARLDEPKFGYLSQKDKLLLRQAIALGCEAFLTVERKLPRTAAHLERELGIQVLTPVAHWKLLGPWAALWL